MPRDTLKVMRDNGLRLLLVGYETGNQQILHNIKKGMRIDVARRFTKDCHELGIIIHGTFIMGLPGETKETIAGNHPLRHRDQPAHHSGVARRALSRHLPVQAGDRERLVRRRPRTSWSTSGVQIAPLHYPHLSHTEIFQSVEDFYKRFYFRAPKIASIVTEMVRSPEMMKRRLREGVEFFEFLRGRRELAN